MRIRSLCVFALLVLAFGGSSAVAQMTVYNNTADPVWVWVATYSPRSEIISGDASVTVVTPARAQVDGPWKITAYGGFARVNSRQHILVVGPGFKRHDWQKESKNTIQYFPMKKGFKPISFNQTFQRDPYADTWAGWRQLMNNDPTIEMRTFLPTDHFKDAQGRIRITNEKLGW